MKKTAVKITCVVGVVIGLVLAKQATESTPLRTSKQGMELIGNAEGCYRNPYQCPSDVLTVGIGTTDAVEKINPHKIYSNQEIADLFAKGLAQAENCVNQHANGKNLPQGAFDAAVSITFNVGCAKMQTSTLFKYARANQFRAMCNQFPRWIYANGKVLKGLIDRRQKEKALCLTF